MDLQVVLHLFTLFCDLAKFRDLMYEMKYSSVIGL